MIKRLLFALLPLSLFSQPGLPLQIPDSVRFLALGDSYTIGQSVGANERWPAQLSDSLASRGVVIDTMRIIATTGWRTDDLLNAISNQHLQQQHYNLVSLLIGVNNQYQGRPFSQYVEEFLDLLDSAIAYAGNDASHVFIVSIPDYAYTPFGQQSGNTSQISSELAQYNQYAKHVADSANIHFFDITPISQQGLQNPSYVASDGLHPSGTQYAQWVKLMLTGMTTQTAIVVGLHETKHEAAVTISPNPATELVEIRLAGNNTLHDIELYSATGTLQRRQTMAGAYSIVPLQDLPDGLYTICISSGDSKFVKRVVRSSGN